MALFNIVCEDTKKFIPNNLRTMGAPSISRQGREELDFYATDPIAVDRLLIDGEVKLSSVWEPCCGEGHISNRLKDFGIDVFESDIYNRGVGETRDFFNYTSVNTRDIVTNPPYKYAEDFIRHALDISIDGVRVFMFLKLQFLEGKQRYATLYNKGCLKTVYVCSSRINCARDGDFDKYGSSAVCYAWFEFQKGYRGDTTIRWIGG